MRHLFQKSLKLVNNCRCYSEEGVRVRFAPSPTGFLHLGGLRTALYNHLFAKTHNGKFIVRIEDTDQSRLVEGAVEQLQNDLTWAGINIDEGPQNKGGHGPYIQSQRLHLYQEHVRTLLNNQTAYHCFCTEKRLELLKKEAFRMREIPKYDNRCRNLTVEEVETKLAKGVPSCIRFKLNSGALQFEDMIFGTITCDISTNEGDPIIVKSDGYPTYHFANVVDDHFMEISHVLRGVEWQISTPKHIAIYRAFQWKPPKFGHLPLLLNSDGTKLSKRQGDIKISYYRDNGIFPLALINFIVHSGGGFTKDSQQNIKPKCYTMDELAQQFDITRINSHSGKLMPERLLEFNRLELRRKLEDPVEESQLIDTIQVMVKRNFSHTQNDLQLDSNHIRNILKWSCNRIHKLQDLLDDDLKFIWVSPNDYKISQEELMHLRVFTENLSQTEMFEKNKLNPFFKQFCKQKQLQFSKFMKTLRSILSGLKEGPSVAEMMEILGKDTTLQRLELCIKNKNT